MKKNNVNEQRRDFLKKTSLGVAGSALSGGMVGIVSKSVWGSDNICIRKKKKFGGKNWLEPLFVGLWRF